MGQKITKVSVNAIYPMVQQSLSKNTAKYKKNIQNFMESRSKDLYDIAPFSRMPFGDNEREDFFKSMGFTRLEVREKMKDLYYWNINFSPAAAKDELTMTMMMVIRYFILKKDSLNAELSAIYLSFSGCFYPSIHYGSFPKVQPSEYRYVMEYVVNNMLTQKFDLKREGSVFGAIRSICKTWLSTYEDTFKDPDDEEVAELIKQLHGRIKSFMKNIATLYYEAYENKSRLTFDSDSEDEDNFRIADSDSLKSERYVENTMTYINTHGVDFKVCQMSSDSNVKVAEVQSIIESIQDDRESLAEIKELVRIIIGEYMSTSKDKDIKSLDFINKSIAAKPNTKNQNIIRQKQIIEGWLDEKSPNYRKRKSREATRSSYYKSILKYYVIIINRAN